MSQFAPCPPSAPEVTLAFVVIYMKRLKMCFAGACDESAIARQFLEQSEGSRSSAVRLSDPAAELARLIALWLTKLSEKDRDEYNCHCNHGQAQRDQHQTAIDAAEAEAKAAAVASRKSADQLQKLQEQRDERNRVEAEAHARSEEKIRQKRDAIAKAQKDVTQRIALLTQQVHDYDIRTSGLESDLLDANESLHNTMHALAAAEDAHKANVTDLNGVIAALRDDVEHQRAQIDASAAHSKEIVEKSERIDVAHRDAANALSAKAAGLDQRNADLIAQLTSASAATLSLKALVDKKDAQMNMMELQVVAAETTSNENIEARRAAVQARATCEAQSNAHLTSLEKLQLSSSKVQIAYDQLQVTSNEAKSADAANTALAAQTVENFETEKKNAAEKLLLSQQTVTRLTKMITAKQTAENLQLAAARNAAAPLAPIVRADRPTQFGANRALYTAPKPVVKVPHAPTDPAASTQASRNRAAATAVQKQASAGGIIKIDARSPTNGDDALAAFNQRLAPSPTAAPVGHAEFYASIDAKCKEFEHDKLTQSEQSRCVTECIKAPEDGKPELSRCDTQWKKAPDVFEEQEQFR